VSDKEDETVYFPRFFHGHPRPRRLLSNSSDIILPSKLMAFTTFAIDTHTLEK